jgi:hypothetical protein
MIAGKILKDIEATQEAKLAKAVVWIEDHTGKVVGPLDNKVEVEESFVVYAASESEGVRTNTQVVGRFAKQVDAWAVLYWARIEASNPALARQMRWKLETADQWGRFEEEVK